MKRKGIYNNAEMCEISEIDNQQLSVKHSHLIRQQSLKVDSENPANLETFSNKILLQIIRISRSESAI